jgi:hypothetical protein
MKNMQRSQRLGRRFVLFHRTGRELERTLTFYLDLYHGKCRKMNISLIRLAYPKPAFTLNASYNNITDVLTGKLESHDRHDDHEIKGSRQYGIYDAKCTHCVGFRPRVRRK